MCGIFAYAGTKKNAANLVLEGLKRLDYRGHDSWGVGVLSANKIFVEKHAGKVGQVSNLLLPASNIAIGHTRWATNGAVNDLNAHPHFSSDRSFVLAQNGIVENYEELKKLLLKEGFRFYTETDTEVIVRLIEKKLKTEKNLESAIISAFKLIEGRNTIIILSKDGRIIAARNGSPLVLGINHNAKETYFSSDILSFAPFVDKVLVLDNGRIVSYKNKNFELKDIKTGKNISYKLENNSIQGSKVNKEGYPHFMIKEINETPFTISRVIKQNPKDYLDFAKAIKKAKNVYIIGSGTAGASAAQIAFYLRTFGKIPAVGLIGAEAREYFELFRKGDLIIAPSQSGETADVLEVLEAAKKKGVRIASVVNMLGSMITRMSDYKFMSQAGPEICVLSTKIFVSHLAWGYIISKAVQGKFKEGLRNLSILQKETEKFLKNKNNTIKIKALGKNLANKKHIFLMGKSQNLQIIKEGMVKIIEGTYIHAHAIPAGDLKHYAITLMDKGVPVIAILSNDNVKKDVINAINEVRARGAEVIGIASKNQKNFTSYIETADLKEVNAIINVIPLQLLAYYMAVELGNDVDKPRNIAKSVTVK